MKVYRPQPGLLADADKDREAPRPSWNRSLWALAWQGCSFPPAPWPLSHLSKAAVGSSLQGRKSTDSEPCDTLGLAPPFLLEAVARCSPADWPRVAAVENGEEASEAAVRLLLHSRADPCAHGGGALATAAARGDVGLLRALLAAALAASRPCCGSLRTGRVHRFWFQEVADQAAAGHSDIAHWLQACLL